MAILDLSVFKERYYEVKMPEGNTITLPKPTQRMVIKFLSLRNINEKTEPAVVVGALNAITLELINSNIEGKVYEAKYVEDMPIQMKTALINGFSEFIAGIQADPT